MIVSPKKHTSTEVKNEVHMEEESPELRVIAEEILGAVERKSASELSASLQAFFQMCEMMPHEEGEHVE